MLRIRLKNKCLLLTGVLWRFLVVPFCFFFNAYITLPQTDNSSQPLWQSGNPADPLLCILLAWAP